MSKITFAEDAWDEYLYWQMQDKKTVSFTKLFLKTFWFPSVRDIMPTSKKPTSTNGVLMGFCFGISILLI